MTTELTGDMPQLPAVEGTDTSARYVSMLLGAVAVLICVGFVFLYSASALRSSWEFAFVERQFKALGLGLLAYYVLSYIDYHHYYRWRWVLLGVGVLLLAAVLVPGIGAKVNGARRWFRIGGQSVQPSEMVKILAVLGMAALLYGGRGRLMRFLPFMALTIPAGVFVGLVALEPDMGTAALLSCVMGAMIFVAGARTIYLLLMGALVIPPAAILAATRFEYIMGRVQAWLEGSTSGKGYHAWMSKSSIGSGGLTGVGLGRGEANLAYLPEAHTDFIYAVIGQETGLIGAACVLAAFAAFAIAGIGIARRCHDGFGALAAFGLTLMISIQAAFNIAVVTAAVPTKGIALPMISYGGTGLVCNLAAVGLLVSIARYGSRRTETAAETPRSIPMWGRIALQPEKKTESVHDLAA